MSAKIVSVLLRKLKQISPLTAEEHQKLATLPFGATLHYGAGQIVSHEGEHPTTCKLILDGYACRYRILQHGKRQIVSFNLAGDLLDLTGLLLGRLDHGIAALTPLAAVSLPHAPLMEWIKQNPLLAHVLWRNALVDAAIFREWAVNLGARSAYQRIAHLFCELITRMRAAELIPSNNKTGPYCLPPIRQADLADATGLTLIHLNRTLRQMRQENLINTTNRTIVVTNLPELRQAAGFDPTYLHQLLETAGE